MHNSINWQKVGVITALIVGIIVIAVLISTTHSSTPKTNETPLSRMLSVSIFSIARDLSDNTYEPLERARHLASYIGQQTEDYGFVRKIEEKNSLITTVTLTEQSDDPLSYAVYCDFNPQHSSVSSLTINQKIKFFGEIKSFSIGPQMEWCEVL